MKIPADLIRDAMQRIGIPGVAVGILHGDEEFVAGFGVTSVDNPLEVDGDTLFQVGSITKTFVATAVMRLVEMGHLELDEPVRSYVPELQLADEAVAEAVTIRHLLNHTGGWAGDYAELGRGDDVLATMVEKLGGLEQMTPLGEVFAYNNSGFCIAGRAIEKVTGEPFEDAMRELVLAPLDLERSFLFPEDVLTHRFAVGHNRSGAVAGPWALPRSVNPAGGLIASVRELLRYASLQWEGGDFLSVDALSELRRPQMTIGRAPGYGYPLFGEAVGLSWFLIELGGRQFMTHCGGTIGQMTRLVIAPEDQFALTVLTNHEDGFELAQEVEREVLEVTLGVLPLDPARTELSPDELAEYVGDYEGHLHNARVSLADNGLALEVINRGGFLDDDTSSASNPPKIDLTFEAVDSVVLGHAPNQVERSEFLRDSAGNVTGYRVMGRLLRRTSGAIR